MTSLRSLCLVAFFAITAVLPITAQENFRLATWNIQALGSSGSTQWNRSIDVLDRVGADIVALQEIDSISDILAMTNFSAAAGYAHFEVSETSGTLSGDLYNGIMSVHPIVFSTSHSAADLSGDGNANDITRDIFEAHVQIPGAADVIGVFSVHFKASSGSTNDFRRMVEITRLRQAVDAFRGANPGAPYVVCGDFNDDIGDGGFGNTFNSTPGGLPSSYSLGNDISFPISNDPFGTITNMGEIIANTTQEDSTSIDATREASGRRLDYLVYGGGVALLGDEIYNSDRDNGSDDGPAGNWLSKFGSPLPSSWSTDSSDHFIVFMDGTVPSAMVATTTYPGSNDDFVMETSINAAPFSTGAGNDVRSAITGDSLNVHYFSPGESTSGPGNHAVIVAQQFYSGNVAPTGSMPGMWFDLSGAALPIYDGFANPTGFQPFVAPVFGGYHAFTIPAGYAGESFMIQTVILSNQTATGWVGFSDGHRLNILF